MKIAVVSLDQTWEDKVDNQLKVSKELQTISSFLPDLVIFPEMTLTGFTMNPHLYSEEKECSETIIFFSEEAIKNHCFIAFGVIISHHDMPTNNLFVVNDKGIVVGEYEKIHPFSFSGENDHYKSGNSISSFSISGYNIGLTICYDLRFPELFQALSGKCSVILNIANWPQKRVYHWDTLLKARAIENQVFLVGVNRTGKDGNNLEYQKSSVIVDPNGNVIKCLTASSISDIYDVDIPLVNEIRAAFPVKRDRKVELYKTII